MFMKKQLVFIILFLVALIALTACAPQAAARPAEASQPVAAPTSGPAASATSLPQPTQTSQPADTAVPSTVAKPTVPPAATVEITTPHFAGLSSGLDNASQARLRTISEVWGAPRTDVYVNGLPAYNGGMAQQKIGAGQFSGWLYLTPGTYTIALVPHGGTLEQALFAPTDVTVEAGHRYTVAAMGQLEDKDVHPLVVDETTLEAGLGASPTDMLNIDINNMTGVESLTEMVEGKSVAENIKYGEARAFSFPSGNVDIATLVNNATSEVLWQVDGAIAEPGTSLVIPWFGPFPAPNIDAIGNTSQGTSELNVIDFLRGFNQVSVDMAGHPTTFNTLLAAIEKAGFEDQLINSEPYFLLAPIDEAFDALDPAEKDRLLNDPQALMNLLNAHIVDGYYPSGSLSGSNYGHSDRTLTNRFGDELEFYEDSVNGQPIISMVYVVGNGNRVQFITTLLPYQ